MCFKFKLVTLVRKSQMKTVTAMHPLLAPLESIITLDK
jgi:hypothetical protein